ncbi:MAG: FAD-dependent oxidoreductase, partial [Solirubrobacteraceae bacterium]
LDGPTSEVWIDPWIAHLRGAGIALHTEHAVVGIDCRGGRVAGVRVDHHGAQETVTADHYIAAMPVEQLRPLLSNELVAADPHLAAMRRLRTRWMNGVMFYLHHDVPVVSGHTIYSDSDWALTSISQHQFWPRTDLTQLGDGTVRGVLSVDVSDWERPSRRTSKVASKSSADEIKAEVWAQLKDALNDRGHVVLDDANLASAFLDEDITFPNPSATANAEPLLINTAGSWADRPDAATRVPNLFLASDFVRTYTDLATMEGANEAARRAVNAILDATRSSAKRCDVWKLSEPAIFGPARALDRLRWKLGHRPAKPPLRVTADGGLEPVGLSGRLLSLRRRGG